jgi:hypothetical protein
LRCVKPPHRHHLASDISPPITPHFFFLTADSSPPALFLFFPPAAGSSALSPFCRALLLSPSLGSLLSLALAPAPPSPLGRPRAFRPSFALGFSSPLSSSSPSSAPGFGFDLLLEADLEADVSAFLVASDFFCGAPFSGLFLEPGSFS